MERARVPKANFQIADGKVELRDGLSLLWNDTRVMERAVRLDLGALRSEIRGKEVGADVELCEFMSMAAAEVWLKDDVTPSGGKNGQSDY